MNDPACLEAAAPGAFISVTQDADAALVAPVLAALRTIYDPEIPVNVYDLGLIYRLELKAEGIVEIAMTLTAPGCPVADDIVKMVHAAVASVDGIGGIVVNLVFDPPWDRSRMSEEAQLELGLL